MLRVWHTYVTGNVCMSTGSKDRNSVAFHFKLFGFSFLPVVLVTVLKRQNNINNDHFMIKYIERNMKCTYLKVKSNKANLIKIRVCLLKIEAMSSI